MAKSQDYSEWSHEQLQDRLKLLDAQLEHLEKQLSSTSSRSKLRDDHRSGPRPKPSRNERSFDPSKYSFHLIALKFAYLGKKYNGFEYHNNNTTRLPTVEETLWKALMKARLIAPTHNPAIEDGKLNFDGCEYSKCGRTDKGVSAFGQVISVRVRSNRPLRCASTPVGAHSGEKNGGIGGADLEDPRQAASLSKASEVADDLSSSTSPTFRDEVTPSFHPIHDEIPYCEVLNRILPPEIRILAWCPAPAPDFSSRFSCGERRYTYFFLQPAFTPMPGPTGLFRHPTEDGHKIQRGGYLDILAMQRAAQKFEGLHDFRNFCKVDPSKQLDNFERRIFHASVTKQAPLDSQRSHSSPVPHAAGSPLVSGHQLYAFNLHGSAFLWHQVRHMVAILFLIGQGLEPPSLIDDLLDVSKIPCKPQYEMADATPLVLWDCIFPHDADKAVVDPTPGRRGEDAMAWIYVGEQNGCESGLSKQRRVSAGPSDGRYGLGGSVETLSRVWREKKMDEILAGKLLDLALTQGNHGDDNEEDEMVRGKEGEDYIAVDEGTALEYNGLNGIGERHGSGENRIRRSYITSQKVFQGGDGPKYAGTYVPVMRRPKMEPVDVINARYRERKGYVTQEEILDEGYRTVPLLDRRNDGGNE